jgi:hypothetical protein
MGAWVFGRLNVARNGFSQLQFTPSPGGDLELAFPSGEVRRFG